MAIFCSLVICIIAIFLYSAIQTVYSQLKTVWCKNQTCLIGKTAVVTGANTGIGYQTSLDFAKRGARVILACRNRQKAEEARLSIIRETHNENVVVKHLDLSYFKSVRAFAQDICQTEKHLDILVNNAAVLELAKKNLSPDGYLLVMQVNYLSLFLLTHLLMGLMGESRSSRIINVSSILAKFAYGFNIDKVFHLPGTVNDYSFSKLCVILFTSELAKRLKNTNITVYSADPGVVDTDISKEALGPLNHLARQAKKIILKSKEGGAQTIIYCATQKGIGKYSGENFLNCERIPRYSTVEVSGLSEKLWNVTKKIVFDLTIH